MNLYILQAGNYFKIGKANNIDNRVRQLQTGCPNRISIIATKETNTALVIENEIHWHLRPNRSFGEWFLLTESQVKDIITQFEFVQKNDVIDFASHEMDRLRGNELNELKKVYVELLAKKEEEILDAKKERDRWQNKWITLKESYNQANRLHFNLVQSLQYNLARANKKSEPRPVKKNNWYIASCNFIQSLFKPSLRVSNA